MPLLLALCGVRSDLEIKEVLLAEETRKAVAAEFLRQEHSFLSGIESTYDSNWIIEPGEIAVTAVPSTATIFSDILFRRETTIPPFREEMGSSGCCVG